MIFSKKTSLLFIIISALAMACQKNDEEIPGLEGNWIETSLRQDTIQFEPGSASFVLRRGREFISGFLIPKSGAGLYNYYIAGDNLYIRWTASSNSNFQTFSFSKSSNGSSFEVGNFFFDGSPRRSTLRFEKMR
jgi:hypothetical protein